VIGEEKKKKTMAIGLTVGNWKNLFYLAMF
jgi:hypothetical protein